MWGDCAGERARAGGRHVGATGQGSARPLADATVDVPGLSAVASLGLGAGP